MSDVINTILHPNYTQDVTVFDGTESLDMKIQLQWNDRSSYWMLNLFTVQGRAISVGTIYIKPASKLTEHVADAEHGRGGFIVRNNRGLQPLVYESFAAGDAVLYYFTEAEYDDFTPT